LARGGRQAAGKGSGAADFMALALKNAIILIDVLFKNYMNRLFGASNRSRPGPGSALMADPPEVQLKGAIEAPPGSRG
jgi:hypothetical protein